MNSFLDKLSVKWAEGKFICVGLDQADFSANQKIVDATFDLVCAYKPNAAFYEAEGLEGTAGLEKIIKYLKDNHPDIPIILDAKRGDIGNTNAAYVKAVFDSLGADALTVNPYLGKESLQPFLDRTDKGIFVIIKTSNPGAGEFQDLLVEGRPLYQVVAEHLATWNSAGNLAAVVGATYPQDLAVVRRIIGDMPILVPGIGTQGGDLKATIKNGLSSKKQGLIVSASRSIIFAPDPRAATLKLHEEITGILKS